MSTAPAEPSVTSLSLAVSFDPAINYAFVRVDSRATELVGLKPQWNCRHPKASAPR